MTAAPPADPRDTLHGYSPPQPTWATTNLAEAMPGVPTPLGWTFWAPGIELAIRAGFRAIGALRRDETGPPTDDAHRVYNIFFGRAAVRVDFFCEVGDRMPGTTGEAVASEWFSTVPAAYRPRPTKARYPAIATSMPLAMARLPHRMPRFRKEVDGWWRAAIARSAKLDLRGARTQFIGAEQRFVGSMQMHSIALMAGVQPVYQQVHKVFGPSAPLIGMGSHEEMTMVSDLWACSRGAISVETVLDRHGYHGPTEGEISGRVWRVDPAPLEKIIAGYRSMPDSAAPDAAGADHSHSESEALRSLPRAQRGAGRVTLRLARAYLPMRGVGKIAFLQSVDVGRAAASRMGFLLADAGVLADPDDVWYLTADELKRPAPPADARDLVAFRRERRTHYQHLDVPGSWQGMPQPVVPGEQPTTDVLRGLGVSPGVVEGRVRVIHDPADTDIEPGEILVARTTDPSWAAVMFPSAGLIVDIGGMLSHAAVVARELGLPCVMDTSVATRVLRTGDEVRVDGTAGTVQVLRRAG